MVIDPIPTYYRGEWFRSRLEADWAATFDFYDIKWQYEPDAVQFGDTRYLPDFYLPAQRVWVEVKGPADDRIDKPIEFQKALDEVDGDKWDFERQLVIIGRPSQAGRWAWEGTADPQKIVMLQCAKCHRHAFLDYHATWQCRSCNTQGKQIFGDPGGTVWWSGELSFHKAPRSSGRAA